MKPLVRNVVSGDDYQPDSRHAHFNRDLVPEMVQNLSAWNTANLDDSWLKGLAVGSLQEHLERLKNHGSQAGLEQVWESMDEKQRCQAIRRVAQKNRDWEVMKVLARLAERLQQKLLDVESQKTPPGVLTEQVEKS